MPLVSKRQYFKKNCHFQPSRSGYQNSQEIQYLPLCEKLNLSSNAILGHGKTILTSCNPRCVTCIVQERGCLNSIHMKVRGHGHTSGKQLLLSPSTRAYLTLPIQDARGAFSRASHHQSAHPLLFDPLCLFLLLPLGVGVPRCHRFGKLLDLPGHRTMVLLEIFRMLQNAVQVFLKDPKGSRKEY